MEDDCDDDDDRCSHASVPQTVQDKDFVEPATSIESESDEEETVERRVCLPSNDVIAECFICFKEYQSGDTIVWSTMEGCPHAFCQECILTWLSRGKKRCPVCRQWFVPPKPIAEQKKEWSDSEDRESEEGRDVELGTTEEDDDSSLEPVAPESENAVYDNEDRTHDQGEDLV